MKAKPKVWVLTREICEYEQDGEYFEAVFENKPTLAELAPFLQGLPADMGKAIAKVDYVLNGGGEEYGSHTWYRLKQVPLY